MSAAFFRRHHESVIGGSSQPPLILAIGLAVVFTTALVMFAPSSEALIDAEEALLAAFWVLGVAINLWWMLSLALVLTANRSGSQLLQRLSLQVTMPLARRFAQGSLAIGLIGLPACGADAQTRPTMVLVESGVSTTLAPTPTVPATEPTTTQPTTTQTTTTEMAPGPAAEPGPPQTSKPDVQIPAVQTPEYRDPDTHTISKGEDLWSIAKAHLSQGRDDTATNGQVGPYWAQLVELNRDSLRSGNINLIFPGEVVDLPPIPQLPAAPQSNQQPLPVR